MSSFPLKIVTPDGIQFDGVAKKLIVRTETGDLAVLAKHINYVAPLGRGQVLVEAEEKRHCGICAGGILSVINGTATVIPTEFCWKE